MQYRLIESFSNSTDPLFPLPANDNQIPVTRIPGKFEKDEKLRGTIPEFSEASENAKKEKVIPSWLKCTSRGKKITEEIGSIEKWGKIGLKFSDIIPDIREIKIRNFSFNISEKLNFTWKRDAWKRDCERSITILRYLILSYLIFAPRKQEIRPIERKIDQIVTKFDNGNSVSRRMGVFPLARIFSLSFYDRIEQPCPTNIFYIVFEVIVARSGIDSRKTRDDEDILSLSKFANGIY